MEPTNWPPKPLTHYDVAMGVFLGLWSFTITALGALGVVALVLRWYVHRA